MLFSLICGAINLYSWVEGLFLASAYFGESTASGTRFKTRMQSVGKGFTNLLMVGADIIAFFVIRFIFGGARSTSAGNTYAGLGALISIVLILIRNSAFDLKAWRHGLLKKNKEKQS